MRHKARLQNRKDEGKDQNLKKMSPIDSARRALQNEYHIMGFVIPGRVVNVLGLHS